MIDLFIAGVGVGIGTFFLTYVLVYVDGWVTANWIVRVVPQEHAVTSDDVIDYVGLAKPKLATWMGCPYCMTTWFALCFTLLVAPTLLTYLTAIGTSGIIHTYFEIKRPE